MSYSFSLGGGCRCGGNCSGPFDDHICMCVCHRMNSFGLQLGSCAFGLPTGGPLEEASVYMLHQCCSSVEHEQTLCSCGYAGNHIF